MRILPAIGFFSEEPVTGPVSVVPTLEKRDELYNFPAGGVGILSIELPLKSRRPYVFSFQVAANPVPVPVDVDLYAPGYDHADQQKHMVILPQSGSAQEVRVTLNSGNAPPRGYARIITDGKVPVEMGRFVVLPLTGRYMAAVGFLLGILAVVALVAVVAVYRSWRVAGDVVLIAAIALFVTAFAHGPKSYDNRFNVPTALSILTEGNTELSEYAAVLKSDGFHARGKIGSRHFNFYPIGTPLLSMPLIALGNVLYPGDLDAIDRLAGRCVLAILAALFFLLTKSLVGSRTIAWMATLCLVFGTTNFSLLSGANWSHGPTEVLLVAAVLLLHLADKHNRMAYVTWAGLPLALGFLCRPTAAVFVAVFMIYVFIRYRRKALPFAALQALVLLLFMYWSKSTFGTWLPPYYMMRNGHSNYPVAFAGLMVSPNRGLFIYTPMLLFGLPALIAWIRRGDPLQRALAAAVVVFPLVLATWPMWWGGQSYGPRLMTDVVPLWCLLTAYTLQQLLANRSFGGWILKGLFVLTVVFSILVQLRGIFSEDVYQWQRQRMAGRHPGDADILWNCRDLQMLHGLNVTGSTPK